MSWIETVNRYWFEELGPDDWFSGRAEIDAAISARFAALRETLKQHPPDLAELDADGHVAAVIVLDQFSRHLFRKSPEAFSTDGMALSLATHAVESGLDKALGTHQRHFLYMPFMHSEDPSMQAKCVALFLALGNPELVPYAEHHKGIIDRFGRFPHRNEVLGRVSTEEEVAFLRTEPAHP